MASAGLNVSNRGNASDFIGECIVTRSCEPCMKTNTSKTATLFCKDCQEFLCETCRNPHIAYKSGQHGIIIIQERESSQVVVDMKGMDMCKEHGKGIEFFCEDHSKLCCTTCVITHRRCDKVDEIAIISLQKGEEIDNMKWCLLKLESDADANVIECKQSEKQLNESIIDISKKVDDLKDRLIKQIEEAKCEFLTKANALKCDELKRQNDRHALNTKSKDEINEILSIFSAISKQGSIQQIYIYSKQIEETYRRIRSDIKEQRTTTKMTISYPRELLSFLDMGSNFLEVKLERTGIIKFLILSRRN
ncbi:hypothetical protein DPMN_057031 [Dreissena polymorpha]|uniref:B box-type domain-containing protein n=1 Tax=Dreissena polymorpha TaxID=45954 RepID=A0A9D4CUD8_DREPO|nr:hypothetical protein DPMN_057031 [Dreissena polymorpha]